MLASGALLGVISGLVLRRDWRRLTAVQIRWLPLLLLGLLARGATPILPGFAFALFIFAIASTTLVAAINLRIVGALLIAVGGGLNLAVVLLNGGMPVDPAAAALIGTTVPVDALHVTLTEATRLGLLGDVVALPIVRSVYSAGDFFIAVGGFLVPFVLLLRR